MSDTFDASKADERLCSLLSRRLIDPGRPGLWLGAETAAALARACPPAELPEEWELRLESLARSAALDLEFESAMSRARRQPTLGAYLSFLRQRAGLAVAQVARRAGVAPSLVSQLEADLVGVRSIPAAPLAALLRRLSGSLEQTEQLLAAAIRAPRLLGPGGAASLYRRGGGRAESVDGMDRPRNPEYVREREAVRELARALRDAWNELEDASR